MTTPLDLPDVGADNNTWGTKLNGVLTELEARVAAAAQLDEDGDLAVNGVKVPLGVAEGSALGLTAPLDKVGVHAPQGWGASWYPARDNSASALCEVVAFGDSLLRGEGPTAGLYSFLQRAREKAVAAGFTDGGRGYNNTAFGNTLDNFAGEVAPISARTGFAASDTWGVPGALYSTTAGDTVTFKVTAPRARLWWSRFNQGGRFSYSVNGAAAVTVNSGNTEAPPRSAGTSGSNPEFILLGAADGMTPTGTNTIVVTNLGGNPTATPVLGTGGSGPTATAGNVPAGTYYYAATAVAGGGETVKSNVLGPYTAAGGTTVDVRLSGNGWSGTFNLYRATSAAGPFKFVGQTTGVQSFVNAPALTDNAAAATAQEPPAVGNAGLNPSFPNVAVNIEAIKDSGIVWHNHGISGADVQSFFNTLDIQRNQNAALAFLGLQWGLGSGVNGIPVATTAELLRHATSSGTSSPQDPAKARKPKLVILAFGTNDGRLDWPLATPAAPSGSGATTGTVPAGTYYYKVRRHLANGSLGFASPASAGVTVDGTKAITVTAPASARGLSNLALFSVYRSTTSGGTYNFVGQVMGHGGTLLDNATNVGAVIGADPVEHTLRGHTQQVDQLVFDLGLAITLIRNAGADPLVILPALATLFTADRGRGSGPLIRDAIRRAADTYSAAWVDWEVALGPVADRVSKGYVVTTTDPHILKPAYQAQGDFLWNELLSL